jgi:phage-related protein
MFCLLGWLIVMPTTVSYYITARGRNPVEEFIFSLSHRQQNKIFHILRTLETYGELMVARHLKHLTGTSFWEIRILGKDNIRIFYVTVHHDQILLLHGFIKKSHQTPPRELILASNRWREWEQRSAS